MNSIEKEILLVENFYRNVDVLCARFKEKTGLDCIAGCGLCCTYPKIECYPLEFLPYAKKLRDDGLALDVYRSITSQKTTCILLSESDNENDAENNSVIKNGADIKYNGKCSQYAFRGLLCRTFGFAVHRDKYGKKYFSSCAAIKKHLSGRIKEISSDDMEIMPLTASIFVSFADINPSLCAKKIQINQAIKRAIEYVLNSGYYRNDLSSCDREKMPA